ncbi:MAG: HAMP domain-containing protein [Ruminiclostridium sp.]|nr:HAMP domain-containing protein [Ruminiclostridium sp.]
MSTRIKIFISYLVMGILPLFLFLGTISFVAFKTIADNPFLMTIGEDPDNIYISVNHLSKIEILAQENPTGLFDRDMLMDIDQVVSQYHIGIMLLDSEKALFYTSDILLERGLVQKIISPQNENFNMENHFDSEHFFPPNYHRLVVDDNFLVMERPLEEGNGTLYIAIETGPSQKVSGTPFKRFMSVLFIGVTGLILLMTFMVTRSMMQSLKELKKGVHRISEGDLDFSIKTNKRDEVAQVVMAFDEMRLRLKASIDAQVREDESRRELVTNISHDLKTPVTAIKGYVEGLIDGTANTPEKKQKYTQTILSKTIALDRMIDDLFLYSSLDVGKAGYHFENVTAVDFFKILCNETRLDLKEKGFEVQCSIDLPPDIMVRLDRSMIQRLQYNLTENAVKYARESDRKVVFSARIQDGFVICSTEDNGAGITEDALASIFERFYRADAARTSTVGGTGLGLQISRKIVEDHGGRIWAESHYGEFTRILWTLPVIFLENGGNA